MEIPEIDLDEPHDLNLTILNFLYTLPELLKSPNHLTILTESFNIQSQLELKIKPKTNLLLGKENYRKINSVGSKIISPEDHIEKLEKDIEDHLNYEKELEIKLDELSKKTNDLFEFVEKKEKNLLKKEKKIEKEKSILSENLKEFESKNIKLNGDILRLCSKINEIIEKISDSLGLNFNKITKNYNSFEINEIIQRLEDLNYQIELKRNKISVVDFKTDEKINEENENCKICQIF